MAPRKPQMSHAPRSGKVTRTGFEKMQMSNERTRKDIARINLERAQRTDSGKPLHPAQPYRR